MAITSSGLIIIMLFTIIIHAADTLSYSIRFAGVRVGKYAVALSLVGIIVLISRTSNLVQAPLAGKMIDHTRLDAEYPLELYFRMILGASSLGTLIAIILFPTFVLLASRAIVHFEMAGSIPKLLTSVTYNQIKSVKSHIKKPTVHMFKSLRMYGIPKRFLLINSLVNAIYTTGVLSALYASYLSTTASTAASQSSGLINGVATIILIILIDPKVAILSERAMGNDEEKAKLGKMYGLLMVSRLAGTLLAQLLLIPAAYWINWIVTFL
jgi:hypothetical protein